MIDQVFLTVSVPYRNIRDYINAFDIGVAPFIKKRNSEIGLSPLKIRDYAACGVPIVSTRIRGLEIIEEESIGILTSPEDSKAIADAIIKLFKDRKMREEMGNKGRKVAEERFPWKLVGKQILEIVF